MSTNEERQEYRVKKEAVHYLVNNGNIAEAVQLLDEMIEEYQDVMHIFNYDAYRIKGDIFLRIGLWDECLDLWINHTKIKHYEAYDRGGHFLFQDKRYEESEKWYRMSLDYHLFPPESFQSQNQSGDNRAHYLGAACKRLGLIYRYYEQPELAFSYMAKATWFGTGGVKRYYSQLKSESQGIMKNDKSLDDINKLVSKSDDETYIYSKPEKNYDLIIDQTTQMLLLGLELAKNKEHSQSSNIFAEIQTKYFDEFDTSKSGELDQLLSTIYSLIQSNHVLSSLIDILAKCFYYQSFNYVETGFLPKAIEKMENAIRVYPNNPVYFNEMGYIHTMNNNFKSAIACYNNAIQLDSTYEKNVSAKAYRDMGFIYNKQDNLKKSKEMYSAALEINPKDQLVLNELALIDASENGLLKCPQCNETIKLNQQRCFQCDTELSGRYIIG
jgi:tetratricopeptide (TPR) repeat protein